MTFQGRWLRGALAGGVLALGQVVAPALLANGDTVLSLPANPSTGYAWILNQETSTGLDLVVVDSLGYGPPETDLIGAPAPALFSVSCTGRGNVRLVFDYVSPDGTTVGETRAVDLVCGEAQSLN